MAVYQERIPQVKEPQLKRKSNRKLIVLLLIFFLAVFAILFFRSPYSKVSEIKVYGHNLYSTDEIIQASGLYPGMQFLNVWERNVQEGMNVLKGVQAVVIDRQFPGRIQLHVTEYPRVALVSTPDGKSFPLLANGVVLDKQDFGHRVVDRPLVRTWAAPELYPQLAAGLAKLSPALLSEISEIALTPTPYDKQRITLYMRDGNEVRTVIYQMEKKLVWYPAIVKDLPEGERGIIYMLESTWFSKYGAEVPTDEAEEGTAEGAEENGENAGEPNETESQPEQTGQPVQQEAQDQPAAEETDTAEQPQP